MSKKCKECNKAVYLMEQIVVNEEVYHSTGCFHCNICKTTLTMSTFAALDGVNYCKPHFKQLFKRKGSYNDIKDGASDAEEKRKTTTSSLGE